MECPVCGEWCKLLSLDVENDHGYYECPECGWMNCND